jgi:hypothetical protein
MTTMITTMPTVESQRQEQAQEQGANLLTDENDGFNAEDTGEEEDEDGLDPTSRSFDDVSPLPRKREPIGGRATVAVQRLRVIVVAVLAAAAIIVGASIHQITTRSETSRFLQEFRENASKLRKAFVDNIVRQNFQSLVVLSGVLSGMSSPSSPSSSSSSSDGEGPWPNASIPYFAVYARDYMRLTGVLQLVVYPLLEDETARRGWEAFAKARRNWLYDSPMVSTRKDWDWYQALAEQGEGWWQWADEHAAQGNDSSGADAKTDANAKAPNVTDGLADRVFVRDRRTGQPVIDESAAGPFVPVAYNYPLPPPSLLTVNYNALRDEQRGTGIRACLSTQRLVFGGYESGPPSRDDDDDNDVDDVAIASSSLTTRLFSFLISFKRQNVTYYDGEPFSTMYAPIFESLGNTNTTEDEDEEDEVDRAMVGIISATIKWSDYFANLLVGASGTLSVVIQNSCDGNITFAVQGEAVRFVGFGDLHETYYDSYGSSVSFEDLWREDSSAAVPGRIGIGEAWCVYTLHVYPTADFEASIRTNSPAIITTAMALIFVFAITTFIVYNHLVERRQNIVLDSAEKSNAIVSSLFPQSIHERLLQSHANSVDPKMTRTGGFFSNNRRIKMFLSGESVEDDEDDEDEIDVKPIADTFPHTSVFFADISGTSPPTTKSSCRRACASTAAALVQLTDASMHSKPAAMAFFVLPLQALPVGPPVEIPVTFSCCCRPSIRHLMSWHDATEFSRCVLELASLSCGLFDWKQCATFPFWSHSVKKSSIGGDHWYVLEHGCVMFVLYTFGN